MLLLLIACPSPSPPSALDTAVPTDVSGDTETDETGAAADSGSPDTAPPQEFDDALQIIESSALQDLGASSATVGDLDGDGRGEVVLGAPGEGAGRLWIVSGAQLADGSTLDAQDAAWSILGEQDGDEAGSGAGRAGDVDGDDVPDLLAGAWQVEASSGRFYLLYGADMGAGGVVSLADAAVTITGDSPGDRLRRWSVVPGDLDGDGRDDLLLGANDVWSGDDSGRAYVFLATDLEPGAYAAGDASVQITAAGDDQLGQSVSIVPDIDGDGLDEVVVSAPKDDGEVAVGLLYLMYGGGLERGTRAAEDADLVFPAQAHISSRFGGHGVGDLDGDGTGDVVISATGAAVDGVDSAGQVGWFPGSALPAQGEVEFEDAAVRFLGAHARGYLSGFPLLGDIDGDGSVDLGLREVSEDNARIMSLVLTLPSGGTMPADQAERRYVCASGGDDGTLRTPTDDIDGDGLDDLLFTARDWGGEASDSWQYGRAWIALGMP